jgi:hypothetical protein
MSEYWLAKELANADLVSKSSLDTSITNSSLGTRVTTLEEAEDSIASLSAQVTELTQQVAQLVPVVVNLTYSSTISLTPSQVLNAMMIISTIPMFDGCNFALPSIASLVAYDTNAAVGKGYYVTVINSSEVEEDYAQFTYGSGYSVVGSVQVYGGSSGRFYFNYTNITSGQQAITIYRVS